MTKHPFVLAFVIALILAPAARAGEWRTLQSMETGRSHLSAAAIGNEIIAAGGSGLLGPLNTFEIYDITYDYWRALPVMPEAREQFTMTVVGGEAFVIGGFGREGRSAPTNTVWVYANSISSWRQGPNMPMSLARHGAVAYDGSIYIFGGVDENGDASNRILRLGRSGRGWEELPTRMPEALADVAVAELAGKIYVLGGRRQSGEVTARVDVFDPQTSTWSQAAAMPGPRAEHTAGAVGGRIHVTGGVAGNMFQTYSDHFAYDPATDRWRSVEALRTPRHSLASAVAGDKWYIVGGGAGAGLFTEFTEADVLEVYDPAATE